MYCHTCKNCKYGRPLLIGVMHRQVHHTCTVVHKRQTSIRLTAPRNSVNSVNGQGRQNAPSIGRCIELKNYGMANQLPERSFQFNG